MNIHLIREIVWIRILSLEYKFRCSKEIIVFHEQIILFKRFRRSTIPNFGHQQDMSLDSLRDLSISIIHSSLSHPLGLSKLPSSTETIFTPKERRVLDLQRELDTLSRQIVQARESTGLPEKCIPIRLKIDNRPSNPWRGRDIRIIIIRTTRDCADGIFQSATR